METQPPAAVDERISKDGIHDSGDVAPSSTKTSSVQGRSGGWAIMPKLIEVFGPSPTFYSVVRIAAHRLYCCSGAFQALLSLGICVPVCLHGKTWLPSAMLQACYMRAHHSRLIRNLVQLPVPSIEITVHSVEKAVNSFLLFIEPAVHYFLPSIESLFKNSIYIRQSGFTRPELFVLGDGAIADRDSLAFLPWHVRETPALRTLVCLYTLAAGRFKLGFKTRRTYIRVTSRKKEGKNRRA